MDNGRLHTDVAAPDDDLGYFAEVLFRLFHAGIHYPLGHTIFDRLAICCLQQLRVIFGFEGSVDLEVEAQRLLLNGRHLTQENACFLALHPFLHKGGVAGISFDRSLTHFHLLLATRRLLSRRTRTTDDPAASGVQATSASLGMAVRFARPDIVPDVFGTGDPLLLKITELATRLPKARGQRLQAELSALLGGGAIHVAGFPFATGRDVTELLVTAVGAGNLPDAARRCGYRERDTAILLSFVDALADLASQASQRSQLSLLCRSWCKSMGKKALGRHPSPAMVSKERGGRSCSTAALQRFVTAQLGQSPHVPQLRNGDRRPLLSLVLQQDAPASSEASASAWQTLLATLLQEPLEQREWLLLKGALQEKLEVTGVDHFHALFSEVMPSLRRSPALSSARCLLELWHALQPPLHMHLWPYAADELLLIGMAGVKRDFYDLSDCVGTMTMEVMKRQRSLVERQPAFSGGQLATQVFCPAYTSSYHFFAFLLDTSLQAQVAAMVMAELRRNPQNELIAAVIRLLRPEEEAHLGFLANYLSHAHNDTFPESLAVAAARLMVESLPLLDEKSKEEPWLERTIAAMAIWHGAGTMEVLEKIVEERRFAIMPTWNRNCRRAAEIALERLRQVAAMSQTSKASAQERRSSGPRGEEE